MSFEGWVYEMRVERVGLLTGLSGWVATYVEFSFAIDPIVRAIGCVAYHVQCTCSDIAYIMSDHLAPT